MCLSFLIRVIIKTKTKKQNKKDTLRVQFINVNFSPPQKPYIFVDSFYLFYSNVTHMQILFHK